MVLKGLSFGYYQLAAFPEMTEFSLVDGAFSSVSPERTKLRCKKEACIIGMSGLLGLM